jgi:3-oxoacyl-[acyl-carrier protein] reductase
MSAEPRLNGRRALVTGAGRGLGRAIATRLAADGADVMIHYRSSEGPAHELVADLQRAGRAACFRADLRDPDQCAALVAACETELGGVDILVNNAGVSRGGPLLARDVAGIRETIETNLVAALLCTAAALPGMLTRRFGRVVVISSPVAEVGGLQGQCAYAASKAGLVAFVKTLANEISARIGDFTANAVSPGVVPTDFASFGIRELGDQLKAAIPLSRFGTAEEVAAAVAFVVSPEASYVNGHDLAVDGGYRLKYVSRTRAKRRAE